MPRTKIPAKTAHKILATHKKVVAHRATKAGVLRQVFDGLNRLVKLLADLQVESDQALLNDIDILQSVMLRFRRRVSSQQNSRTRAFLLAYQELGTMERLLKDAAGSGYGVRRLASESERDLTLVRRLRENLELRQREAAFVLAELEQAVDPLPGMRLASAKRRLENDKRRQKASKNKTEDLKPPIPEDSGNSTS